MESKSLTIISVVTAGLASLCCIGPLVAVGMGLGAFGAAAFFESVRPYLLVLTASVLGSAFYLTYRKTAEKKCEEGVCTVAPKRTQELALWMAATVAIPLAAFPYYSGVFWIDAESNSGSRVALAAKSITGNRATALFDVEGMTCAGCASGIQATLTRREGIESIEVRYAKKTARVAYDPTEITEQQLISSFQTLGYTVTRRTAD